VQTRAWARGSGSVAIIVRRGHGPGELGEALLVWALLAASGIAIAVTYSRIPPEDLYHVTGTGLRGGLSRALVYTNFPVALTAIPIAVIAAARIGRRWAIVASCVAVVLSAAVFWPGVVKESDLDARPVNAIAALGVALALALTVVAARRTGARMQHSLPSDAARLALAAVLLFLAVPWIAADAGFHLDHVSIVSSMWQTGELRMQPDQTSLHPAVHLGHHHGLDGTLLALAVLALSRMRLGRLAIPVSLYLAALLAYGLANVANDFWLEQIVKRGWTSWEIPSLLQPAANPPWAGLLAGAVVLWMLVLRPSREERRRVPRSRR
jgi:hypothetical protein